MITYIIDKQSSVVI